MITITLAENINAYYIKAIGHSGNKGTSIVCASVSVLLETWRLSESVLENHNVVYNDGLLEASIKKTQISEILFKHLCIGLKAVKQQYPNDICLVIGGY
ncbi:MAG: ribosomal-processing cysteine protease Prp [Brevinemataceae bacterium]